MKNQALVVGGVAGLIATTVGLIVINVDEYEDFCEKHKDDSKLKKVLDYIGYLSKCLALGAGLGSFWGLLIRKGTDGTEHIVME